jgi:hypothetical protein
MLSVANRLIMMSVIRMCVIMMNVLMLRVVELRMEHKNATLSIMAPSITIKK